MRKWGVERASVVVGFVLGKDPYQNTGSIEGILVSLRGVHDM